MRVNYEDFKYVIMLIDIRKNIVIFPISKSNFPYKSADGSIEDYGYFMAYYPIEIKYPYNAYELAEKIKCGIDMWNKYPCYMEQENNKLTFEEKYYGIKGFKNAMKGNLHIRLGWNDIQKKFVSIYAPLKRGYAYIGLDETQLSDDAGWIEFAKVVIEYINMDITKLRSFKIYKSKLNL